MPRQREREHRLLEEGSLDVLVPENVHRTVLRLSAHRGMTIVVGRRQLAKRVWAFVYPETPSLEPIGAGRYRLTSHDGHTHLEYELEGDCELCAEIGLPRRDSFIVAVMNPDPSLWPDPQEELFPERDITVVTPFPPELQLRFNGNRYTQLAPEFLDWAGTELVLIR